MGKKNPCDACHSTDNCEGCALDRSWKKIGECANRDCFCNYDCGCLLGLDGFCKASTCFKGEEWP